MYIKPVTDKNTWDKFLNQYAPDSLFQTWNWGEVVNYGMEINNSFRRIGLYDDEKLLGIAQIVKVRAKRGTFLHIRHGPVLASWDKEYLIFLLNSLKKDAKNQNIWFIRISPQIEDNTKNNQLLKNLGALDSPIHAMDGEYVWVLPLDKDEKALLTGMRKTTRYLIKKAAKIGVVIEKSDDINNFLKLYEDTTKRHRFVKHKGLEEEFSVFSKEGQLSLYFAKYDNKIIAGALILFIGNQAIYHHGASISNEIPGSYAIQWEAIKEAKQRGKSLYNFWGIAPEGKPHHPWNGLTLFKTGFGGEIRQYLHTKDIPLTPLYILTYGIETVRKWHKGY